VNEKLTIKVTKFTLMTLKNPPSVSHMRLHFRDQRVNLFIKINILYSTNHMKQIILTELLGKKAEFLTR